MDEDVLLRTHVCSIHIYYNFYFSKTDVNLQLIYCFVATLDKNFDSVSSSKRRPGRPRHVSRIFLTLTFNIFIRFS